MYLKEIQTYGFKSFADKINFELTRNINGIVGPNGSGKSTFLKLLSGELEKKDLYTVEDLLNGLAKLTMHLYNQGIDKRDIKRAVKYGLSLGRTEEE